MSNRSIRCIISVSIDIQIRGNSTTARQESAATVAGQSHGSDEMFGNKAAAQNTWAETGREEATDARKSVFFDINDARFQSNLTELQRGKYRGYAKKVARNEREGRYGTYDRQEGV